MLRNDFVPSFAPILEPLEPRIAPATFFLTSTGDVVDKHGNDVHSGDAAALEFGASKAVLLKKGDKLVYDADGDLKIGKANDTVLFQVRNGASFVLLDDLADVAEFPLEMTGVIATAKFAAATNGNVHGDIATMLGVVGKGKSASYEIHDTLLAEKGTSRFLSTGYVTGSLLSGGNVSKVSITGNLDGISIAGIRAGAGANTGEVTFGDSSFFLGDFEAIAGTKGASISNIQASGGILVLAAGDGGDVDGSNPKAKPGVGGFISKVTISGNGDDLSLIAGNGGSSPAASTAHGAGGFVSDINVNGTLGGIQVTAGDGSQGGNVSKITAALTGTSVIRAGDSGYSGGKKGFAGGAVENLTLTGSSHANVEIVGGQGGVGSVTASAGGQVSKLQFLGAVDGFGEISLVAGDGADGTVKIENGRIVAETAGADGGSISEIMLSGLIGSFAVTGGDGGNAAPEGSRSGGNGTSIAPGFFEILGSIGSFAATGGNGGSGGNGLLSGSGGNGGTGGSVANFEFAALENISITAGNGGNGGGQANGGAAGSISNIATGVSNQAIFKSGIGGNSGALGGNGADGGSLTDIHLNGLIPNGVSGAPNLSLQAGDGGNAAGSGTGGVGAAIDGTTLLFDGTFGDLFAKGGNSGAGNSVTSGGSIYHLNLDISGSIELIGGNGNGGPSGSVSQITLTGVALDGQAAPDLNIHAANGIAGILNGDGSSIDSITLDGTFSSVTLTAGDGADGGNTANGGRGGNLSNIVLNATIGTTTLQTGAGGSTEMLAGNGGNAGSFLTPIVIGADIENLIVRGANGGLGGSSSTTVSGDGTNLDNILNVGSGVEFGSVLLASGAGGEHSGFSGGKEGTDGNVANINSLNIIHELNIYSAGSITNINVKLGDTANVHFTTADAAFEANSGSISNITFSATGPLKSLGVIDLATGNGGEVRSVVGNSGAISNIAIDGTLDSLKISTGTGGRSAFSLSGDAGSISNITAETVGTVILAAGKGGSIYYNPIVLYVLVDGGNGGSISQIEIDNVTESLSMKAGNGGNSGRYNAASGLGTDADGGNGGSVTDSVIGFTGVPDISAGAGGGATGNGQPGTPGVVQNVVINA